MRRSRRMGCKAEEEPIVSAIGDDENAADRRLGGAGGEQSIGRQTT